MAAVVLTGLAAVFVGWEGVQGRFSTASHASIFAVIVVMLGLAWSSGRGRQRQGSLVSARGAAHALRRAPAAMCSLEPSVVGAALWLVVIAATVGWDAASFVEEKHSLPTLSRICGAVTDHDWGRAVVFAAWLALGAYLALGFRLSLSVPPSARRSSVPRRSGHAPPPSSIPEEEPR